MKFRRSTLQWLFFAAMNIKILFLLFVLSYPVGCSSGKNLFDIFQTDPIFIEFNSSGEDASVDSIAVGNDGSIYGIGRIFDIFPGIIRIFIAKYDIFYEPDSNFGVDGVLYFDFPEKWKATLSLRTSGIAKDPGEVEEFVFLEKPIIRVDSNGNLIVAVTVSNQFITISRDRELGAMVWLFRLTPSGNFDLTFGDQGLLLEASIYPSLLQDLLISSDDHAIVLTQEMTESEAPSNLRDCGFYGVNSDGEIDPNYIGTKVYDLRDGSGEIDWDLCSQIKIDSKGRLITSTRDKVLNQNTFRTGYLALNLPDGTRDLSLGSNGIKDDPSFGIVETFSNGRILLGRNQTPIELFEKDFFTLSSYFSDSDTLEFQIDLGFPIQVNPIRGNLDSHLDILLASGNGSFFAIGTGDGLNGIEDLINIAKYKLSDGSLDESFFDTGITQISIDEGQFKVINSAQLDMLGRLVFDVTLGDGSIHQGGIAVIPGAVPASN